MIQALLLDFDGLLYDTESASFGAWEEIYTRHGVQLPVALWVAEVMGRPPGSSDFDPVEHLQEIAGVEIDRDQVQARREIRRREMLPDHLMPGAARLLAEARRRGLRTAIVTSNSHDRIREHLARARCEHPWDAIVCADGDVRRGKPSPVLYLEAMATLKVAAAAGAKVVLGHLRGRPSRMMEDVSFDDVVREVGDELGTQLAAARDAGCGEVWADPGIGFGKVLEHNLALLQGLPALRGRLGVPVMVGVSRKSFIGQLTGKPAGERVFGTAGAVAAAVFLGASAVRVHDVDAMRDVVRVAEALAGATS